MARLSDTDALVRKGTYPYALKLRGTGTQTIRGVGGTSPAERPELAEQTFSARSPSKFASDASPDKGGGSLRGAIDAIPKGC